ncbi:Hsp33 family molecular chaperone HslO [Paenibacillus daejeonensis]|uniref:Hsp33 family molecular chaperone HslO n=1 Tax=Paenibacillus daejeonensis TaxID=135193 RepID=UPI00037BF9D3|nr:Hsp33 family molecular chaperone HslO [Paenibacillus daejeonensis]
MNTLIKCMTSCKQARLVFADTSDLLSSGIANRELSAGVAIALARLLTIAGLTTGFMKDKERVTYTIRGSQRELALIAEADDMGRVSGYANEACRALVLGEHELEMLIGPKAYLQVIRDIGMPVRFTGIADMPYGTVTDDAAHFYTQSEQTPTRFWTTEQWTSDAQLFGRGVAIQLLPGAPAALLQDLMGQLEAHERQVADPNLPLSRLPHHLFGITEMVTQAGVQWHCDCSRELFSPMLYTLDRTELEQAIHDSTSIEFVCHRCGTCYAFTADEIAGCLE